MIETHPFGSFVPKEAKYLILGSFTTKVAFNNKRRAQYKWFYANGGRNQFWPILESVYKVNLQTRKDMRNLLTKRHFAIADIIYKCERKTTIT